MKTITLGKKIGLGFGSLILIATLLGGLALINMRLVSGQAQKLSTQFVPESQIAGEFNSALATAQLAVRSYGLTADEITWRLAAKGWRRCMSTWLPPKSCPMRMPTW